MTTSGDPVLLELTETISGCRDALAQTVTKSKRTESLKFLANALMTAYGVSHSEASVLEAVSIYEEILRLQPPGHQDRAEALSHLGDATFWLCLYHAAGDDRRAQCVALLRETLHLRPPGHPLRDQSLHNLARALCFVGYEQQSGGLDGLTECVQLNRDALELRPAGHSERANSLNNLGCALSNLFECRGDPDVLVEAIEVHSLALQLRPEGHPLRDGSLNNLAYTLRMSFEHFGGLETLSDAITLLRESLQLRPAGHPMHAVALDNLASLAYLRSSVQGLPESLSEAVLLWRKSCQAMSADYPLIGRTMTNLAEALIATHRQDRSPSSLAEAMLLLRQALDLLSPGDHRRHESLECLAKALIASFDEHGDRTQLAEAEILLREVLQSRSRGHHDRLRSLQTLGNLLCKPESRSWEEAHVLYGEALATCPRGSPARSQLLSDMSQIFLDPESPLFDLGTGLSHLSDGYSDSCSHVHQRLASANLDLQRVEIAYMTTPKTKVSSNQVLALYAQVIGLLPRLANFGLDHCMRLRTLSATDGIARTAATRALIFGRAVQAVEMLEEGRSVFWSQSLHLRSAELDDVPDNDRQELERLLCSLDIAACRLGYSEKTEAQRERDLEERRRLNEQAEALISKIRGYPGLERFLLPPSFDSLLQALPDGFVVIVNSSKLGHHALLLHRLKGLAATLELEPSYAQFDVEQLRAQLPRDVHALTESHFAPVTRAMRVHRGKTASLDNVLASMWDCVVRPIISALGLERAAGRARPRLWWCVTGELGFLPIHAAGNFAHDRPECAADYVVSSYIPTLHSLVKAKRLFNTIPRTSLAGLIVCEELSESDAARHLPHAAGEVCMVKECFEAAKALVLNFISPHTSTSTLRALLQSAPAQILHLACHSIQDQDPLKNALVLQDGNFTIEDIMQLNLSHTVLAYLSACQTAKGDKSAPDQAIHIAASMLFCGVRSVVGTMWLMNDQDGPHVARRFYQTLFDQERLDLDSIPYALDEAVQSLRQDGVPASRWALYMHMGG